MTARRASSLAVALLVLLVSPLKGQGPTLTPAQAAPFTGTWIIRMSNPAGAQETVRITEKSGAVAATVQLGKFPPSEVTGMLKDGDMLVLTTTRLENGVPIRVVMALTVDGDMMTLAQMLEQSTTIKRGTGTKQK